MSAPNDIIKLCLNKKFIFSDNFSLPFDDDDDILKYLEDLKGRVEISLYNYRLFFDRFKPILNEHGYVLAEEPKEKTYSLFRRNSKICFFSINTKNAQIKFKDLELFGLIDRGPEQQLLDVKNLNKDELLAKSYSLPSYGMRVFANALCGTFAKKFRGGSLIRSFRNIYPLLNNFSDIEQKIIEMETSPYIYTDGKNENDPNFDYYSADFNSFYPSFLYIYKLPWGKPIQIVDDPNLIKKLLKYPCEDGGFSYDEKRPWPFHNSYPHEVRHFYYIKFKKLMDLPFKTFDFLEFNEGCTTVIAEALYFIENYINHDKKYVEFTILAAYTFQNSRLKDKPMQCIKNMYEQKKKDLKVKRMMNSIVGKFGSKISKNSWHYFPLHRTILMLAKIRLLRVFWRFFKEKCILYAHTDGVVFKIPKGQIMPFVDSNEIGAMKISKLSGYKV